MDLLFPRKHTNGKFRLHHLFRSSADASPDDNEINCFTSVNIICTNLYTTPFLTLVLRLSVAKS